MQNLICLFIGHVWPVWMGFHGGKALRGEDIRVREYIREKLLPKGN